MLPAEEKIWCTEARSEWNVELSVVMPVRWNTTFELVLFNTKEIATKDWIVFKFHANQDLITAALFDFGD